MKKIDATKRKNKSWNASKAEKYCEAILKEKFNNIETQYKSSQYPFKCDFYINDIDTYIEYNFHPTHGGHPFNQDNLEDIKRLNELLKNNTRWDKNIIEVWTKRDVQKIQIAIKNNLNYLTFYNLEDFNKWISLY